MTFRCFVCAVDHHFLRPSSTQELLYPQRFYGQPVVTAVFPSPRYGASSSSAWNKLHSVLGKYIVAVAETSDIYMIDVTVVRRVVRHRSTHFSSDLV